MTTPRDPDELASALLDGLLSDDEAAAARRDPAVVARLAELAAVREAVGTPPPPPDPASRERSLAAALAAFDAADGGETDDPAAAVAPMTRTRAARSADTSWRASDPGRRGRWLTAAAVILVVVGLGFLARDLGSDGDSDDSAGGSAVEETSNEAGSAASGDSSEGEDTGGGQAEEASEAVDLGDVGSPDALADRARASLPEDSDGAEAEQSGDDAPAEADQGSAVDEDFARACEPGGDPANGGAFAPVAGTVVLQGRASLDGQPVDVWVVDVGGAQRLVAVAADCTVVVDQPLEN